MISYVKYYVSVKKECTSTYDSMKESGYGINIKNIYVQNVKENAVSAESGRPFAYLYCKCEDKEKYLGNGQTNLNSVDSFRQWAEFESR